MKIQRELTFKLWNQ